MLHVEAIAESEMHIGSCEKLVRLYGTSPDYLYQLADHGPYFTAKRVYTRDDERLLRLALDLAEAHWPTNTAVHSCHKPSLKSRESVTQITILLSLKSRVV